MKLYTHFRKAIIDLKNKLQILLRNACLPENAVFAEIIDYSAVCQYGRSNIIDPA